MRGIEVMRHQHAKAMLSEVSRLFFVEWDGHSACPMKKNETVRGTGTAKLLIGYLGSGGGVETLRGLTLADSAREQTSRHQERS